MKNLRWLAIGLLVLGVAACGDTPVEPHRHASGGALWNAYSVGGNSVSPDSSSVGEPTQGTGDGGAFSVGGN